MKNKVCGAQKNWEIERENLWAPGYMYITKILTTFSTFQFFEIFSNNQTSHNSISNSYRLLTNLYYMSFKNILYVKVLNIRSS